MHHELPWAIVCSVMPLKQGVDIKMLHFRDDGILDKIFFETKQRNVIQFLPFWNNKNCKNPDEVFSDLILGSVQLKI